MPLARAHTQTTFVVPHFGAGFFREALMLGSLCENVYLDTSSSNGWTRTEPAALSLADVLRRALGAVGPRHILFGTDSGTLPRGFRADLLAAQREALASAGASSDEVALILGGNADRVFG